MMGLRGRTVIVTGGGQGLGRAYCSMFAQAGAKVVVADINATNAENVAREVVALGSPGLAATCDVTNEESVADLVEAVCANFGTLDILVNNAAIFSTIVQRPFDELSLDEWERVMAVNANGAFVCAKYAARPMRAQEYGRIVNVSSGSVRLGAPNYLHYVSSKAALIGMTRSLARELGPFGVTVNAVLPGGVRTEVPRPWFDSPTQIKASSARRCIPRAATPQDVGAAVLFFASDESAYITGQSLAVDGGATFG